MKRCNNCGYIKNPVNVSMCQVCKNSLVQIGGGGGKETIIGAGFKEKLKQKATQLSALESKTPTNCLKCNYTLRNGAVSCPNCGYNHSPKGSKATIVQVRKGVKKSNLKQDLPKQDLSSENKYLTLNPNNFRTKNNFCFDTDKVVINRKKIDDKDESILARSHVRIEKRGAKWILINSNPTAQVLVSLKDEVELKDGDILMIGNKKVFEVKISDKIENEKKVVKPKRNSKKR